MKPMKIGNVNVKNRMFLSPMVDVTDLAYRMLCRKHGAGMAYTEMIYIDAILHENERTKKLMKTSSRGDNPVCLQITGNSTEEFKKLAKKEEIWNYDLIDINCGCPSIRITGNKAGSYLLKNPDKISEMIRILKDTGQTVTAKIRLGFKENNVLAISKKIEKAGADALTIHARLANQGASVPADWKFISQVKNKVGIPVIGNGDIFGGEDFEEMLDIADAGMVARGAIGNPYIFREIQRYLKTGKEKEISRKERFSSFDEYLRLAKKYDIVDIGRIKYLGGSFFKGFDGAAKVRNGFMKLKSFDEIESFVGKDGRI